VENGIAVSLSRVKDKFESGLAIIDNVVDTPEIFSGLRGVNGHQFGIPGVDMDSKRSRGDVIRNVGLHHSAEFAMG
jgi:hypothetical protein